jgi:hypothetical protein
MRATLARVGWNDSLGATLNDYTQRRFVLGFFTVGVSPIS